MSEITETIEELKDILDAWIPKYIRQEVEMRTGQRLTAERFNELMNLLITQGDDTIELAETVKQYVELLTQNVLDELEESVDTMTSELNSTRAAIESEYADYIDTVDEKLSEYTDDFNEFSSEVTSEVAQINSSFGSLTTNFSSLTSTVNTYQSTVTSEVAAFKSEVTSAEAVSKSELDDNVADFKSEVNSTLAGYSSLTTSEFNAFTSEVDSQLDDIISDVQDYQDSTDLVISDALVEIEEALSAADDVVRDASAIYSRVDAVEAAVSDKVDAVEDAVAGNFAGLDATGHLTDSGKKAADFATLDGSGRIPYSQLPESAMELKGTWNASTNTPTLANGTGTNGDFYIVTTAGTWNGDTYAINDRVLYVGATSTWTKLAGGDISSKADKVSGATNGHFAGLNASGNLVDSGKKASDFTTVSGSEFFLARPKMISIQNNSDLNTFIVPGSYGTGGVSASTNIANSPFGSGFPFSMIVESQMKDGDDSTYGYFRQTAKKFGDDVVMTRRTTNGGANWTAWVAFAMSSETKTASHITAGTFLGQVNANATAAANIGTFQVRDIKITSTEPTEGSALDSGKIVIVI